MRASANQTRLQALLVFAALLTQLPTALAQKPIGRGPGRVAGPAQPTPASVGQQPPNSAGQAPPQAPNPGAPTSAPGAVESTPPLDLSPLSRYVPGDSSWFHLEFPGLNATSDTWRQTAAHAMLNETTLGDMMRDLLSQIATQAPGTPSKLSEADTTTLIDHVAQHGFVAASPGEFSRPGGNYLVLVLRNAAHKSVRAAFGKLLGQMTPEGTKPKLLPKPGGRQVVFLDRMPGSPPPPSEPLPPPGASPGSLGVPAAAPAPSPGGSWAWWVEKNDLVVTLVDGNAADDVIAVLDGTRPSAADNPILNELRQPETSFTPAAFGFILFDRPGASADDKRVVDQLGLKRVDFRWGFDGKALTSIVRADAPSPRKNVLKLFDQPGFSPSDLPAMPTGLESFVVVSLDPTSLFDQLGAILDQVQPGLGSQVAQQATEAVRTKTRQDLRRDLLSHLGPRTAVLVSTTSSSRTAASAGPAPPAAGPLAGALGILGGLEIPDVTILFESRDSKAVEKALDALVLTLNDQLKNAFPVPADTSSPSTGRPAAGGGRRGGGAAPGGSSTASNAPKPPEPPKFQLTSISPKTYTLLLPAGMAALTRLSPTFTMGQKHLIFASNPTAARIARTLETNATAPRWAPDATTAESIGKLPANLMLLGYSDTTDQLPEALATLPATLQATLASLRSGALPGMGGPLGLPTAGTAPGAPNATPTPGGRGNFDEDEEGGGRRGGGRLAPPGPVAAPGAGSQPPGAGSPGIPPGGPGAPAFPGSQGSNASHALSIQIDPAKIPTPDALRPHIFPSTYSVVVDERGIRLESREAFPDPSILSFLTGGLFGMSGAGPIAGSPAGSPSRGSGGPAGIVD